MKQIKWGLWKSPPSHYPIYTELIDAGFTVKSLFNEPRNNEPFYFTIELEISEFHS